MCNIMENCVLEHWSPGQGIRAMLKRVRDVRGIRPCYRDDVGQIMKDIDPSGLNRRSPGKKKMEHRKYLSRGPNNTWHIDGNDKLKFFGIWVHLAVDGFSRKIIWLKAGTSNWKQRFISRYFYSAVREHHELIIEQMMWNTHDIHQQRNVSGPFGKPDVLFISPPHGFANMLCHIDDDLLQQAEQLVCGEDEHSLVANESFRRMSQTIL
ncbi:uncharacterized protein [Hoplias malabaricus]|uniref:uncharacterized protein isoform X2 n=1 Tax=Hoplias malabaricus TaxID=27720 RepID=UPI00346193E5